MQRDDADASGSWTFITNHAAVLLAVAVAPERLVEDIATEAGITRRRALGILADLEAAGYVHRTREGRRNRYTVDVEQPMRHRTVRGYQVKRLISAFTGEPVDALGPPAELVPPQPVVLGEPAEAAT